MADKDIKIGIETTGDTKGAEQTKKSIAELNAEVKKLQKDLRALPVNSKEFAAIAVAAKEAERALEGARVYAGKLGDQLALTGEVGFKMSGKLQGKFQQAGYQVQDLATQVAMGTSAVSAFGQQAPQLLGAFGPTGAVAGAFISLGALAYGVFSKMGGNVQSATEKLEAMKRAIDEIAKNKSLELEDEFADSARAIDDAASSAAALKQEFIETKKAVNALVLAQLELSGEKGKAGRVDQQIKGRPANVKQADWADATSPLRAIGEDASGAVEKQREVARQALGADQDRLKTAKDTRDEASKMLEAREQEKNKAQGLLEVERETLSTLRLQKEAKEKLAKENIPVRIKRGTQGPDAITDEVRERAKRSAKADLSEGSPFTAQIKIAEGRIEVLEKSLTDNGSKLNTDITGAKTALDAANTKLTDTTAAVTVGAETIQTDLESNTTKEITALKQAGLATGKTVTEAAKDAIDAVEKEAAQQGRDINLPEQEAVGRIKQLIADTVPDSAQGGQLQGLLQGLANNLTAKDAALAGGVERLIGVVRAQAGQYTSLLNKITDLEAKAKQTK